MQKFDDLAQMLIIIIHCLSFLLKEGFPPPFPHKKLQISNLSIKQVQDHKDIVFPNSVLLWLLKEMTVNQRNFAEQHCLLAQVHKITQGFSHCTVVLVKNQSVFSYFPTIHGHSTIKVIIIIVIIVKGTLSMDCIPSDYITLTV